MENKKLLWGLASALVVVIIIAIILSMDHVPSGSNVENPLPTDFVELADGTFISLSYFYEMGYLYGTIDAADYIAKQNIFKENEKATLNFDTVFNKRDISSKLFFEQNEKVNEIFNKQTK